MAAKKRVRGYTGFDVADNMVLFDNKSDAVKFASKIRSRKIKATVKAGTGPGAYWVVTNAGWHRINTALAKMPGLSW